MGTKATLVSREYSYSLNILLIKQQWVWTLKQPLPAVLAFEASSACYTYRQADAHVGKLLVGQG